jgi:hypothetical protein
MEWRYVTNPFRYKVLLPQTAGRFVEGRRDGFSDSISLDL